MTVSANSPSWVETDLDAIRHNVRTLRAIAGPDTQIMAVLKADAYGHGAQLVAPAALASGATYLALANLAEAARLREVGIDAPILLLGYTPPDQARAAIALNLAVTLFDADVARALSAAAQELGRPARVHLKVDTGMNRLGLLPNEVLPFTHWVAGLPGLHIEGIYTHLATADGDWETGDARQETHVGTAAIPSTSDSAGHQVTCSQTCGGSGGRHILPAGVWGQSHPQETEATAISHQTLAHLQLDRFDQVLDLLEAECLRPTLVHAANSATLLRLHQPGGRHNLVRPGLALYGLLPFTYPSGEHAPPMRPALSWHTRIARIVELPPGTPVSYGATYITPDWRRIATLPVGYADGLRRSPPWRAVLINGQRAPIVGRVCMDYVMCDVTAINDAQVGDRVTLLGNQGDACISAEEVADWLGTSVYEVLTSIGARVGRVGR